MARRRYDYDEIKRMHEAGKSHLDIAALLGCDRNTVWRALSPEATREADRASKKRWRDAQKKRCECGGLMGRTSIRCQECATRFVRKEPAEALTPLMRRHKAAMEVIQTLHPDERYDLLAAVVWPESDVLEQMAVAA